LNEAELKQFLKTLHKNLNTLREREAKFGGDAPLRLLNQIEDHQTAINRIETRLAGEISAEVLTEQLAPLNLDLDGGGTEIIAGDKIVGGKIQIGTLNIPVAPMILLALGLLGIFGFATYRAFVPVPTATAVPGPARMKGLFNVAVTDFGEIDAAGQLHASADGQQLSRWVYDGLRLEFENLPLNVRQQFQPLLWHDSLSPQEKGLTLGLIADDKAAAALARKINAHMVIYGNLRLAENAATFVPEFYVAPVRGEADEIVGRNQLGQPIDLPTPLNLDEQGLSLNIQLTSRTKTLSRFTIGLMYDLLGDSQDALEIFQQAIDEFDWDKNGGQEVFYYFAGRSALFLDLDNEAEVAFKSALEVSDNKYTRAYVGLGGVYLRRAKRLPPDQRLETPFLQQAIQYYQQAIARTDESLEPAIKVTAQLGLGTAYRLEGDTYSRLEQYDQAIPPLDKAAIEIQATLEPLQAAGQYRYLGQAYLSLGVVYAQQAYAYRAKNDKTGSISLYEKARQAYANCIAQKEEAPTDKILIEKIISAGCIPYDQDAKTALADLEGDS
jgi:tetratricopeptide (TPR) repeat protein